MTEPNGRDIIDAVRELGEQFRTLEASIQEQFEAHKNEEMGQLEKLGGEMEALRTQYQRMVAVIAVHNEDYDKAIQEMQEHKVMVAQVEKKLRVLDLVSQAIRAADHL
jgi:uncharacterized coiled-coil DUF342 family protein